MVKNEEKIIERCLRSCLPHVDAVFVAHNGTDQTVPIADLLLLGWEEGRVAGGETVEQSLFHFVEQPWKNFGHNRTLSAQAAKTWVQDRHADWPLDQTYLLFLDADMELVAEPTFDRRMLSRPGYRLLQLNHGEFYPNLRLARLDHDWRSVSVTHEYWAPTPDIGEPPNLGGGGRYGALWIKDHDDGGSKSDKTARDIALLEQGLIDEPGNGRYMFYLARAYADSGKHERAVELYRRRRFVGGWDQEVWYAHYREGLSLLALGKEAEGIGTLIEAYQERPTRAEPLAALSQHHRARGRNHAALMFARQASTISMPDDGLFVWADAHDKVPLIEMAIAGYYVGGSAREDGIRAAESLVARRDIDAGTMSHMLQTLSFYAKPIAPQALRMGVFKAPAALMTGKGPHLGGPDPNVTEYLPKNPAIVSYHGKTLVNLSCVNYHHANGVVFAPKDVDGIVRTRNVVMDVTAAVTHSWETTPITWPEGWDPSVRIRGLEDQRWTVAHARVWFTATCFHPHNRPEVVLGCFTEEMDRIERLTTLQYAGAGDCEKNWVPWTWGNVWATATDRWHIMGTPSLVLIYGFDPFTVLSVNPKSGDCETVSTVPAPVNASTWRGGAPPVLSPWGKWVTLVHVVAHFSDRRVYMHRWVEMDCPGEFRITRWSRLFALDHVGVEYVTGLLDCGATAKVVYGSEEREARWLEFDWSTVDSHLQGGSLE